MRSGLNAPVTSMSVCLQKFALVNPVRWSIDALPLLFSEGAGFEAVLVPIAILTVIGLVSFLAAWLKFSRW